LDYFQKQWAENNNGWFEGYAPGLPSQSNSIEATHRVMKKDLKHKKSRLSVFCHSQEKPHGLVYEWSMQRASHHKLRSKEKDDDGQPIVQLASNKNQKVFYTKPDYSDKVVDAAYKHKIEHSPVFLCISEKDCVYLTARDGHEPTKEEYKSYLERLKSCDWDDLDELNEDVNSFYIINLNEKDWENSRCTCESCLKDLVCYHVVILAAKRRLFSFEQAAMRKPLTAKAPRGPTKMGKNCLNKPVEKSAYAQTTNETQSKCLGRFSC